MQREGYTLHVRNLHDSTRREDLSRIFGRYGSIVDVCIPLDYYTGRPKGFAFIEFEHRRDAEDAHDGLQGHRLLGHDIRIEFARGGRKTPSEMRAKDTYRGGRGDNSRRSRRSRSRSHDRRRNDERRSQRRSRTRSRSRSSTQQNGRKVSPSRSRSVTRSRSHS